MSHLERLAGLEQILRSIERQDIMRVLLSEQLDAYIGEALATVKQPLDAATTLRFNAEDMREEPRLCREEARAAADTLEQRLWSERAFYLAEIAEQSERRATPPGTRRAAD